MMELAWISTRDDRYEAERNLRNRILLHPIGQPDGAWEHRDHEASHLVALAHRRVVGCALLLPHSADEGQLMQMAVEESFQSQGVGKSLVQALLLRAAEMGLRRVFCHARVPVIDFYARQGFVAHGSRFEEVGILHQKMIREFAP